MKKFNHMGFRDILRHPGSSNGGQAQADAALNEFTTELHGYCLGEKDLAERIRTLWFARSGFTEEEKRFHNGAGKKCGHAVGHYPGCFAN
jgi:hypothetical protein